MKHVTTISLVAGFFALIGSMAAVRADNLGLQLRACRAVTEASARLQCYDALAGESESTVGATIANSAPVAQMSPEERFGLAPQSVINEEVKRASAPADVSAIAVRVTSLSLGQAGRVIVGLENGQVWQQLVPSSDLELLKLADRVEISKGLFGSFWLAAPGKRGCKVTRVR